MDTPTISDVVKAIEAAFDGIARGDGVTLHEADAIDARLSSGQRTAARSLDTDVRWQDVPAELIESSYSSLCFVDAKGFCYYIPAFMRWSAQHYKDSESITVDTTIYGLSYVKGRAGVINEALGLLTLEQCRAIALFLKYMSSAEVGQYADAPFARMALEQYWDKYTSA